jgi:acyl-CoA synthetase (NDP forming)
LDQIDAIISSAKAAHRTCLIETESKNLLHACSIPTAQCREAANALEAVALAGEIGYPVVLKVLSPQILHKSDIDGVRVGLSDAAGVAEAYEDLVLRARAIDPQASVTVQPMVTQGVEVIIGVTRDPHFGPVLMFGLGGIFTELFKDVCFRMLPICLADAQSMVTSLKAAALLTGYRGQAPSDVNAITAILCQVSELIEAHPEIAELDLNPVIVHEHGAVVVDARAILAG